MVDLKKHIKNNNINIEKLATHLGISKQTLYNWFDSIENKSDERYIKIVHGVNDMVKSKFINIEGNANVVSDNFNEGTVNYNNKETELKLIIAEQQIEILKLREELKKNNK